MEPARVAPKRWPWMVASIVLVGIVLRAYHYLRAGSVWHDEAALLINVFELDFSDMFGPLIWHEAAPPLLLVLQRGIFLTLGDNILVLRLLPFIASCLLLLLMVPVARSVLPHSAVPWALLLLAFSDRVLRHTCEAKPYCIDAFVTLLLLAIHVRRSDRSLSRTLLLYALLCPVLIFLSYPACFLYGGILVSLLPAVWRSNWRERLAYILLASMVATCVSLLALGPALAQKNAAILSCWTAYFPNWSKPLTIPGWMVNSTFEVFLYCFAPIGPALLPLAVAGGIRLWRAGRQALVSMIVVPVGLALVAACVGKYPYGGARIMLFAAPGLALLIAAGIPVILGWLRARVRPAWGFAAVATLFAVPCAKAMLTIPNPWRRADTSGASAFVHEHRANGDPVLGNDWSHHIYFRRLGSCFHDSTATLPNATDQLWVVYTAELSSDERFEAARRWAPGAWQIADRREFQFTTVLKLSRGTALAPLSPETGERGVVQVGVLPLSRYPD